MNPHNITPTLVKKLITYQFPEFAHLDIQPVKVQGHDNRTFRLGEDMLIRMPTAESYALKVPKEQELLPRLKPHLTTAIPVPLKMGQPTHDYPFPFSIYQWLDGESANNVLIHDDDLENIAIGLACFLNEFQRIDPHFGPPPGAHNWYRGDHISVYDKGARDQIEQIDGLIDCQSALALWEKAMQTKWQNPPVWIHGDVAAGNILVHDGKLTGIIDFGGMGVGDPACDLVIAWTFLKNKSREVFKQGINVDNDTWLRAKAWCLWKATFELCNEQNKKCLRATTQKQIINDVLTE